MWNKDKVSNHISQGDGRAFERSRWGTCERKHLGKCLAGKMVALGVVIGVIR